MNDTKVMNLAADNIRILAASMVEKAKSGHPGGAMGGADFINVLYSEYLQYAPSCDAYPAEMACLLKNDRFHPAICRIMLRPMP